MTLVWRQYTPKTNRLSLAKIFSNHSPLDAKLMGVNGAERGRLARTFTKRMISGRTG